MKRILVLGAGGFLGSHLVKRLKDEGAFVRAVDLTAPRYWESSANEFMCLDLRSKAAVYEAFIMNRTWDEVYQLAAHMGGVSFINSAGVECLHENAVINGNVIKASALFDCGRLFVSSSVCVYRNMGPDDLEIDEDGAYPAAPANPYGWEKLYSEQVAYAYADRYGLPIRIARFHNTYGPYGPWNDGRERAPAALARKVAAASDGTEIEVWGDGTARRVFAYVDDIVEGALALMRSEERRPTNIGGSNHVSIRELADQLIAISGKRLRIRFIPGEVGVSARTLSSLRAEALGIRPQVSLESGLQRTHEWIITQQAKGA